MAGFFSKKRYAAIADKELAIKLAQERDNYPHYKLLIVGDGDAYEDLNPFPVLLHPALYAVFKL